MNTAELENGSSALPHQLAKQGKVALLRGASPLPALISKPGV